MNPNYHKQVYKNKECSAEIKTTECKLARMLAIDSSEDVGASNNENEIVFKVPHTSWKLQNSQKLEAMMTKLKKDITVVMNYGGRKNETISEHHIFIRLDLLNTYIEQVAYIKDVLKKGGTIFEESLCAVQKKTNDILNKIREEVFKAYLILETEDKYNIARQGGQMTCIFTVLGIIERELHSTYEKIFQVIHKRNEHRHKINRDVTELFTSFRSLPALQCARQKSKERQAYIRKSEKAKCYVDNADRDNTPSDKQKAYEYIKAYDNPLKHEITPITDDVELTHSSLSDSLTSCFLNLEEKLQNNSVVEHSSDSESYEDCSTPSDIGHLKYKAAGFEISISDENIQIKIPTNMIYLFGNGSKSTVKSEGEQGENLVNKETGSKGETFTNCSLPGYNSSGTVHHTKNTVSEDSLSSHYTDIITDSEIGMEYVNSNSFKNKLSYNNEKKDKKIINYGKSIPFFSKNCYCNPISEENELTESIHSSEIITDDEKIEKYTETDPIFSHWKENRNLAMKYGSKICNLGNPLFENMFQLVDLIKSIYCDFNSKMVFNHNENLQILSNTDEKNSLISTVFHRFHDCPPSISQSALEYSSIWKESANLLCEWCPGCVSLSKLSSEVI